MRRVVFLAVLGLLVSGIGLAAQSGQPTAYVLKIYPAGSSAATSTVTVPVASVQCNQAVVTGSTVNPTKWRFNDPNSAGRDCVYDDATRLQGLADGNYEATAAASNADGLSAETARVPFVRRRPNPPAVPTGLRVTD
jgi:hypothetical protein